MPTYIPMDVMKIVGDFVPQTLSTVSTELRRPTKIDANKVPITLQNVKIALRNLPVRAMDEVQANFLPRMPQPGYTLYDLQRAAFPSMFSEEVRLDPHEYINPNKLKTNLRAFAYNLGDHLTTLLNRASQANERAAFSYVLRFTGPAEMNVETADPGMIQELLRVYHGELHRGTLMQMAIDTYSELEKPHAVEIMKALVQAGSVLTRDQIQELLSPFYEHGNDREVLREIRGQRINPREVMTTEQTVTFLRILKRWIVTV